MAKGQTSLPADSIGELLLDPKVKRQIEMVIPKFLSPEKLLRVAVTVIRRNYMLMQCTKQSLLSSVMGAAILGLELEPVLGQAYLVPYRNKKGFLEAQLIPGYRGYIALASRSGEIHSVTATEVYANDEFEHELGLNPKLKHIPAEGERGEFKGAYVVFRHKTGEPTFEYMTKDRIDKVMNLSKSKDQSGNVVGPWKDFYEEMSKKTVIRHRAKYEPISIEFAKAKELEERALMGESQIDLLPAPEEAIELESKPSGEPAVSFDELVKQKAKEGKNIARLNDFISAIAEANKATADQVKIEAPKDWENFWTTYEKWLETADAGKETPQSQEKRKRGRPSKQEPKQEEAFVSCPNRNGDQIEVSFCNNQCEQRQGCPSLGD